MHGRQLLGGGLASALPLALTGTQFFSNTSGARGGGAYAQGGGTLNSGMFQGNTCTDGACQGGGLYSTGDLSVTDSRLLHNSAGAQGGGLYHAGENGSSINSLFAGNSAGDGAAIYWRRLAAPYCCTTPSPCRLARSSPPLSR